LIDYSYFVPDFGENIKLKCRRVESECASAAEIQRQGAEMAATMAKYKTSFAFRAMFTYLEIMPVAS